MLDKSTEVIVTKAKLDHDITMYVARHSWASIAKSMNIPINHLWRNGAQFGKTTMIYLKSIDAEK